MVKISNTFFVAALAAPVFAEALDQYVRDTGSDGVFITRSDLEARFGRDFINDIEEREPFGLGLLAHGIAYVASHAGHHSHHRPHHHHHHHRPHSHRRGKRELTDEDLFDREFEQTIDGLD